MNTIPTVLRTFSMTPSLTGSIRSEQDMAQREMSSREARSSQAVPPPGWQIAGQLFEELRHAKNKGTEVPQHVLDRINERFDNIIEGKYKNRAVKGTLLHFAIDRDHQDKKRNAEHLKLVLEARANVDEPLTFMGFGNRTGTVWPLHLAASRDLDEDIKILVENRADVNRKSKDEHVDNYTPVHDAAFLKTPKALEQLLRLRADVNLTNKDQMPPLFLAANVGADNIAELLIKARANLDATVQVKTANEQARDQWTEQKALDLAIKNRIFPSHKLHLLAPFCYPEKNCEAEFFDTILRICKVNVPAAKSLVNSLPKDVISRIAKSVESGSINAPISFMTHIMEHSPEVADAILRMLLVTPREEAVSYHPLPRVANLTDTSILSFGVGRPVSMFTRCVNEVEWKYNTKAHKSADQYPKWHDSLAPKPQNNKNDCEILVKYLSFPNIVDTRVLHALNSTWDLQIFGTLPVQAIVNYTWSEVWYTVALNLILEFCVVMVLTWWACSTRGPLYNDEASEDNTSEHAEVAMALFVLWAALFQETFIMVYEFAMHVSWGFGVSRFITSVRILEVGVRLLLLVFLMLRWGGAGNLIRIVFCLNILARWFYLIHTLRVLARLGEQILPIIHSLFPMAEIFLLALMIYAAFFAAFSSLRGLENHLSSVGEHLFFAMLTGDGDAFSGLRNLDQNGGLSLFLVVCAVISFVVCILNLFIAVYSNVYTTIQSKAQLLFLKERAGTCEQYLLRPSWPPPDRLIARCRGTPFEGLLAAVTPTKEHWHRMPLILSFTCAVVWLGFLIAVGPEGMPLRLAWLLAASLLLLQAGLLQNDNINREYHLHGMPREEGADFGATTDDEGRSPLLPAARTASREVRPMLTTAQTMTNVPTNAPPASTAPSEQTMSNSFLWICHKTNLETEMQQDGNELRDMLFKLTSTVETLARQFNELDAQVRKVHDAVEDGKR